MLHNFIPSGDGGYPRAGVIADAAANLYGTATVGGSVSATCSGCGMVYKVDPSGHEMVLYSFKGEADGRNPEAGVIADSAGNLYGTTRERRP